MTDGELVHQTLDGHNSAYEELVRRWSARTLAFCHDKVGSAHVAEDLAQESLVRGFRALATLAEPDKFGPWLRGIALRVCLDWRKRKQTGQVTFGDLPAEHGDPAQYLTAPGESPDQLASRAEQVRQLMGEVESLPDELREVLMLYYYEDVTYRDVAETLGVSPATVNARLTKARTILRERLSRASR
ncbi:MAG TPA: sigma-70 family RNA polymerase sigma factor [Pirellulales bacterium]|jgi:RNA polymerase sigma-70 factor (ECF subfamily)|nr:sigma-70 family RNA polymerase sigma factor [Pirellulales bacterium]